jgi:hypothetical protein
LDGKFGHFLFLERAHGFSGGEVGGVGDFFAMAVERIWTLSARDSWLLGVFDDEKNFPESLSHHPLNPATLLRRFLWPDPAPG